ncbi:MAG: hypothetical protein ACE5SW_06405 [Nitrososphaeraceae archaeon]
MIIDNCTFPDNLLYDIENFTWIDVSNKNSIKLGITPIMMSISGKLLSVRIKEENQTVDRGKRIGSIESLKYFGILRSPICGKIEKNNKKIIEQPKLVNDSPYEYGWFVKINPSNLEEDIKYLKNIHDCNKIFHETIKNLGIRCFKFFPDHELYEIGSECAATLSKLDDLIPRIKIGEIIYLVSDDITADLELERWSKERSQTIVDMRKEENYFHFLIRKKNGN